MVLRYFVCPKCEEKEEDFYSIHDIPEKRCPKCKERMLQKMGGNFELKCGGFYSTDNK